MLPEWRIDNRQTKLEAQGSITVQTAPQRADEAISRTRQLFLESFLSDGSSREQAEARVDEFLSSPSLCVETIWEAERKRFVEEEKGLDSKAKLLVTLGNLALLPFVLLFINSLPVKESFMSAQFTSNNCQANGGIKCNGVGAQGGGPNIMKALTPSANGGKIIREKRVPPPWSLRTSRRRLAWLLTWTMLKSEGVIEGVDSTAVARHRARPTARRGCRRVRTQKLRCITKTALKGASLREKVAGCDKVLVAPCHLECVHALQQELHFADVGANLGHGIPA